MKNLNKFGCNKLTEGQMQEIDGGILIPILLAASAVSIASYMAGYTVGKDLYHLIND